MLTNLPPTGCAKVQGALRMLPMFLVLLVAIFIPAAQLHAASAANTLAAVTNDDNRLRHFLFKFPKGGDLHTHFGGAVYAESFLRWAAEDGKCWHTTTLTITPPPCDAPHLAALADIYPSPSGAVGLDVNPLIDALSTRNHHLRELSGHNHFFVTFGRFIEAYDGRYGDMLAEIVNRAGRQNIVYIELMQSLGMNQAAAVALGAADLRAPYGSRINHQAIDKIVAQVSAEIDAMEARSSQLQQCDSATPGPGCAVRLRYLAQVLRLLPPAQVYAQTLLAYKLIKADPRVVGLNLVGAEDNPVERSDYTQHMGFIQEIGTHFTQQTQGITLHAGELVLGLVPPEDLGWHIRQALDIAGAKRIGHGIDIRHAPDMQQLLTQMANDQVMVEINLTSNDVILGKKGTDHPFQLYLDNGVPMALSTDDEGVSRIDLTHEYQRAVTTYDLSYAMLRSLSRNALQYSFLPGQRLFQDTYNGKMVQPCAPDQAAAKTLSSACREFLAASEKAAAQWQLEQRFAAFEQSFR